ncbi:hypothetical protein B0H19DRAFT_1238394 [Mycena capillaripes]|nr:hypothetical protein B0H19DRAFT_1238394 [Mycena capillaripes]
MAPVFPLSAEALNDTSVNMVAQTMTRFLVESYETVFGGEDIPWVSIAMTPNEYYELCVGPTGLTDLKGAQWYELAGTLAAAAGTGTSDFFRKGGPGKSPKPLPPPLASCASTPTLPPASCSPTPTPVVPPAGDDKPQGPPKKGRMRKAPKQLLPGDNGAPEAGGSEPRRTARAHKKPEEAKLEREKKSAAQAGAGKVKPGQLAQKPHEPCAAFLHCAEPHGNL